MRLAAPTGVRPLPLHDLLADGRGAGETQLTDVRVLRQTLSHHTACAHGRSEGSAAFNNSRNCSFWTRSVINGGRSLPDPGRMLMTPFGIPALADSSANFRAVSGVT